MPAADDEDHPIPPTARRGRGDRRWRAAQHHYQYRRWTRRRKIYVDGVGATIVAERVEYLDENGKLITESLRDFTKKALKKRFASLDDFLQRWKSAERKQAIIEELENEGLSLEPLGG